MDDFLVTYRKELVDLLHKSQDAFEKQLSYISAGTLTLSIGFIKDVVKDLAGAGSKWMLALGWVLLIATLLINLASHITAAKKHNETIKETYDPSKWDADTVRGRYKWIQHINWFSLLTLIIGMLLITIFVIKNTL